MRHQKQRHKLSRDTAHRKALLMNLSREVIEHERIKTTEAKAKAAALGQDKFVVYRLFEEIAPRYAQRQGGYTRILKLGPRRSDSTEMVFLELV
jgi:large subunit ribosomal protein L17